MGEEPFLPPQAAAVSGQAPVGAQDAVAGHDDRYRIPVIRPSYGPRRPGIPQRPGEGPVCGGPAEGDLQELIPDLFLKGGSVEVEPDGESRPPAMRALNV